MSKRASRPFLAFVWQVQDLHRAVVDMARSTATEAVFDLSRHDFREQAGALEAADAVHAKISPPAFLDPALPDFIRDAGLETLWVEYHPALNPGNTDDFLARIKELENLCQVVPISGDLDFLLKVVEAGQILKAVALKGSEAAGVVSRETLGILFATLEQAISSHPQAPGLIVWGGVGTPEAAAAFLASGAQGVVCESLHWLTDLVTAHPDFKDRLSRLTPEHTTVVGTSLGVSCRVFDKGNSLAARELRDLTNRLLAEDDLETAGRSFAARLEAQATPALGSRLTLQELIFLGPEATLAASFVQRFGAATPEAITGFVAEIDRLLEEADQVKESFQGSPAAKDLGTTYPFIQGAMTWISDIPKFSLAVAEAGGLPTLALGLRDRQALDRDWGQLQEVMGTRPYAVNLIALPENPCLEEQLAWVMETRPPLAVIAAGDPAYAQRLVQVGIPVCYLAPNEGLLRLALQAGVRWVVLEGHEAGGHVGAHSTLTLAQMALELKRREPELFQNAWVVLAGGIFNRATAFRAAMLGADALQMGTVYLATREIVSTGALSPLYQQMILEAQPGATGVSGETVGLGVRSLKTAKMVAIQALEREFAAGREDEASFRHRLEALGARSLLIAARSVREPGGASLDEATCLEEGQFMSGAAAGAIPRVLTLAELHHELAEGPLSLAHPRLSPLTAPAVPRATRADVGRERVGITGMAIVNALGNSPQEIWEASLAMRSGIIEVPLSNWDHSLYFDPDPRAPEKTYCKVAAFQNLEITRKELGIPPQDFRTMSNSTRLTLWLAHQALADSGILDADIPRERIAVLVSQNSGEVASTLRDLVIGLAAPHMIRTVGNIVALTPPQAQAAEDIIKSTLIQVDDTTLLGRLNCTAGGFICNKYGFRGPSFSVSAACATSLVALYAAYLMVRNGVIDAAVVGGGEETLTPAHFLEFSALGALAGLSGNSRLPQQMSRPFDRHRDGMVLGEGGGIIIIERESLARRRGARVHAYITGMGASNSDQGMVESLAETQEIALRAAFADVPYGPETVDLVECHATATMQGDGEEVKALKAFFPQGRLTHLTSFKSQIGHTLGASGLNSLIRGVMAMQVGAIGPSLNYDTPDPQIDLESWGFRVPKQPENWPQPPGHPRRLMVNAFGFGGANYVVHLEDNLDSAASVLVSPPPPSEPAIPEGKAPTEDKAAPQVNGLSFLRAQTGNLAYRLAVFADNDREAREKAMSVRPLDATIPLTNRERRNLERQGLFFGLEADTAPPLALIFAGQGTYYAGMGKELYETFPPIRRWMDRLAEVADFDLLHLLFHSRDENLQRTLWQQPALFTLNYSVVRYLLDLGLKPAAMAGHSLGELVALSVAGVFSYEDGFRIVHKRAQCMDKAGDIEGDPGIMIAVNVPLDILEEKVSAREKVYFTNYNSPRQVVLGGGTGEVNELKDELDREGYWTYPLKVSMAFHSPIMQVIRAEMQAFVDTITFHTPQIPVISNTTQKPFPDDPEAIKQTVMAHLESPVHWMQNVQTLWDDFGARLFVEVGPKDTLCNLTMETLSEAMTMPTCDPEGETRTFRTATARLFAQGYLPTARPAAVVDLSAAPPAAAPARVAPAPASPDVVAAVVQREINTFVLESFGKYLKPAILNALRQEIDPSFSETDLDRVLKEGFGAAPSPLAALSPRAASPAPSPIPAAPPARPAPARLEVAKAAPAAPLSADDYLERIIQIIMDATGYERDEIEPDMDLRQDLAIRSSRLPVIMDAAEREFAIAIRIEDFLGVQTVQDLAERLAEVVSREGAAPVAGAEAHRGPLAPPIGPTQEAVPAGPEAPTDREPLHRLVFRRTTLEKSGGTPVQLKPGQGVAVLHLGADGFLARDAAEYCRQNWQAKLTQMDILDHGDSAAGFDLRTPEGATTAVQRLADTPDLAGLIITLDPAADELLTVTDVPQLLTGLFLAVQNLLTSPGKEFCLVLTRNLAPSGPALVLAEGLLGMFLAAAQEYPDFLFRTVTLDGDTDSEAALAQALDPSLSLMQLIYEGSQALAQKAVVEPASWQPESALRLNPGDVVIISGGARGVTPYLGRVLAPYGVRVALLGRTELNPEVDYEALAKTGGDEAALRRLLKKGQPDLTAAQLESGVARLKAGLEVFQTLQEFSRLGLEARYFPCDVAQAEAVRQALDQVVGEWDRIDGIIHGAGITRDSFLAFLSPEDFSRVVAVKLTGVINLLQAAQGHGLRFLVGLSSAACIQGNPGQANYAAANRAMSAFIGTLAPPVGHLFAKAFMLPPIEGVGMADDPEIKELLKLKGLEKAYVHAEELAQLFVRELFLGRADDVWVMPARTLPQVKTTLLDLTEPQAAKEALSVAGFSAAPDELPMLASVRRLDLLAGELEAERTFLSTCDLWLEDHLPFKFLKHPPVSGIMALETFFEAVRFLHPHLQILGARQVAYRDLLEVPLEQPRASRIHCRTLPGSPGEVLCQVTISSPLVSPTGRELDRWSTNFAGQVILGGSVLPLKPLPGLPVLPEEMETRPMSPDEVADYYENRTSMQGRYRVMESLEGSSQGCIRGALIYREIADFPGHGPNHYQYSPYLLEAFLHLVNFYIVMRDEDEERRMIPAGFGEMRFTRHCREGERLTLEARLLNENPESYTWNARALDDTGSTIMQVTGLNLRWFTE